MGASQSSLQLSVQCHALIENTAIDQDSIFNDLFTLPTSADEIWTLLSPSYLTTLLHTHPHRYTQLIIRAITCMTGENGGENKRENAVRILTRLMSKVIEEPDCPVSQSLWDTTTPPSHAHTLMSRILQCCFIPGYTITERSHKREGGVELGMIWDSGIGTPPNFTIPSTIIHQQHRTELLKLMIVCASEGIYVEPEDYVHGSNRYLDIITHLEHPLAPTFFYSLINTICNYEPTSLLPYGYTLTSDEEPLVDVCLQLLLLLIDYRRYDHMIPEEKDGVEVKQAPSIPETNAYRSLFTSLSDPADLELLYDAICRLLSQGRLVDASYLPHSQKRLSCQAELFVLVWKLLDENQHFLGHVLHNSDVLELIASVLYFLYDARTDTSKVGLMYNAVFILLKLSGEREFAVKLNEPYKNQIYLPGMPAITGSWADVLIMIVHKIITNSPNHLDALLKVVLTLLCNISPYLTTLSKAASVKLVNLFELFTSSKFLYANETNQQYIFMCLDIVNNIIQYQYQGHNHLIYCLLRHASLFQSLSKIPPPRPANKSVNNTTTNTTTSTSTSTSTPTATATASTTDTTTTTATSTSSTATTTSAPAQASASTPAPTSTPAETPLQTSTPVPAPATTAAPAATTSATPSATTTSTSTSTSTSTATTQRTFRPTHEWFLSWKPRLPLEPILRLIECLTPKIDTMCSREYADESDILNLIKNTTLVGVLPVPHSIIVRRYIPNAYTNMWFTTYIHGIIFLRHNVTTCPLFDPTNIMMFVVTETNSL